MRFHLPSRSTSSGKIRGACALAVVCGLAMIIPGCSTPSTTTAGADPLHRGDYRGIWPEPPASPRIGYLFSFSSAADLGLRRSGWSWFVGWLTGSGKGTTAFSRPFATAFDEQGNICITDTGIPSVWFFDLQEKSFETWDKIGPYRLVSPVSIARDKGIFYLADSALRRVLAFRSGKELVGDFSDEIGQPSGLAVAGGRLYVADVEKHRIAIFDLEGHFLKAFGHRGEGPGEFNFPTHVTVDPAGRILVTDAMNARIQVFESDGTYRGSIGKLGDASGHFGRPKGVAVDSRGNVYVADAMFDNFQIFDIEGRFLLNIGESGSAPAEFWMPAGVAAGAGGIILVADSYNRRVQVFETIGKEGTAP